MSGRALKHRLHSFRFCQLTLPHLKVAPAHHLRQYTPCAWHTARTRATGAGHHAPATQPVARLVHALGPQLRHVDAPASATTTTTAPTTAATGATKLSRARRLAVVALGAPRKVNVVATVAVTSADHERCVRERVHSGQPQYARWVRARPVSVVGGGAGRTTTATTATTPTHAWQATRHADATWRRGHRRADAARCRHPTHAARHRHAWWRHGRRGCAYVCKLALDGDR